jgi:hypothetical protein
MNVKQFICEYPSVKAEISLMPTKKFDLLSKLFVLCSRLFEKRNSVLRSTDEMELNEVAEEDPEAFETWQNLIHDVNFKIHVKDGWMILHKIKENKYETDLPLYEVEKAINLTYSGILLFNKRYEILQKRRKIKEIRQSAQIYEI